MANENLVIAGRQVAKFLELLPDGEEYVRERAVCVGSAIMVARSSIEDCGWHQETVMEVVDVLNKSRLLMSELDLDDFNSSQNIARLLIACHLATACLALLFSVE